MTDSGVDSEVSPSSPDSVSAQDGMKTGGREEEEEEAVYRYLQFQDCHCHLHCQCRQKIQYQMNKFTHTIPNILGRRRDCLDCDNNCHFWNFSPTRCSTRDSISGKHCMNASRCVLQKARKYFYCLSNHGLSYGREMQQRCRDQGCLDV